MAHQPALSPATDSAEIIAVGTELLSFARAETNSLRIAHRLSGLGLRLRRKVVVPDSPTIIRQALLQALEGGGVIVLTGGLGPTVDDLTRDVVAETLGRSLREDQKLVEEMFSRFASYGIQLSESNRRQAEVPEGAEVLPNPMGTAPGLFLREGTSRIFLLPGPPRELNPMLDAQVVPRLEKSGAAAKPQRVLKVVGMAESRLDAVIQPICDDYPGVEPTVLSSTGVLSLYFVWRGSPDSEGQRQLSEMVGRVRKRLRSRVFSEAEEGLNEVVARLLEKRGSTLAVAESCTGGLIGKLLTDLGGASAFFLGGVISYSNELKRSLLGVSADTLSEMGAVSPEVANQMAEGVRAVTGSDVGLAVTGIAGPEGGSEKKPVGTVFVAVADDDGTDAKLLKLPGARDAVRMRSAWEALDLLRRRMQV